jgi:WD40 repeat protein
MCPYRNLFLTSGSDGSVKLFHIQEKQPLRQWDPVPPPGTLGTRKHLSAQSFWLCFVVLITGVSGTFSPLNCCRFSPIKPVVFAVGSADGFLYVFDISVSMTSPVAILEALVNPVVSRDAGSVGTGTDAAGGAAAADGATGGRAAGGLKAHQQAGITRRRVGITGLAFNHKQRDLIAACDVLGRVHIWKLSWKLSNRENYEQSILDNLAARINNDI